MKELTFKYLKEFYLNYHEDNRHDYKRRGIYIFLLIFYFLFIYLSYIPIHYPSWFVTFYNSEWSYIFLISVLLIAFRRKITEDIKSFSKKKLKLSFIIVVSLFLLIFGEMIISSLLIPLHLVDYNVNEITSGIVTRNDKLKQIFELIIYAPIVEELVFRLTIRKIIKNDKLFILISTLLFGFIHILFYNYHGLEYLLVLPYMYSGFVLAYTYQKTNNILTTMILHFINNFGVVL